MVWGEQVAGAGFAWASSSDRVVANADGWCSFPSGRRAAEGKHARYKRGEFKAAVLDDACEWMLIKQSGENMLWHLSAFCARISSCRHKNKAPGRESPVAVIQMPISLFPLPLNPYVLFFKAAHCNALHVCDVTALLHRDTAPQSLGRGSLWSVNIVYRQWNSTRSASCLKLPFLSEVAPSVPLIGRSKHLESFVNQKADMNKMFLNLLKSSTVAHCLSKPFEPLLQTDFNGFLVISHLELLQTMFHIKEVWCFHFGTFHLDICEINHCWVRENETMGRDLLKKKVISASFHSNPVAIRLQLELQASRRLEPIVLMCSAYQQVPRNSEPPYRL